jgi:glyoxylase-like metal-dependent hydrolase (beta-lactamase superfamily II)
MMQARTGQHAAMSAGFFALLAATACLGAAPQLKSQAPGYYRMMLGDFEITALSDGTNLLPAGALLQHVTAAELSKSLAAAYLKDPVETSFNGFLINTGSKLVLIDTGADTLMGPDNGHLLANLRAAGYQPEQVDEVYLTHFHGDHVGGLLAGGERAFPNAVVRADSREAKYWLDAQAMSAAPQDARGQFEAAASHIKPYIASGQFKPFGVADGGERGVELVPGIRARATPGHTPGHTSYVVESRGETLLVLGDLVHVAAVQLPKPAAGIRFDTDSAAAIAQRASIFAEAARRGYWVAGAHLSFPGIGHLRHAGSGYVWMPINYGTRF